MHTRCTHCDTVFRITPADLAYARGRVRCGQCLRTFDALEHLGEDNGLDTHQPGPRDESSEVDNQTASSGDETPQDEGGTAEHRSSESAQDDGDTAAASGWTRETGEEISENEGDTAVNRSISSDGESDQDKGDTAGASDWTPETDEDRSSESDGETDQDKGDTAGASDWTPETDDQTSEDEGDTAVNRSIEGDGETDQDEGDTTSAGALAPETNEEISEDEDDTAVNRSIEGDGETDQDEGDTTGAGALAPETGEEIPEDVGDSAAAGDEYAETETAGGKTPDESGEAGYAEPESDPLAITSWELDEQLLNTSTLPELPGLVEHPGLPADPDGEPEPSVHSVKTSRVMNWDDSWDDMSFDDEHGIPLMEDIQTSSEPARPESGEANRATVFDPGATLTEEDLPELAEAFRLLDLPGESAPEESTRQESTRQESAPEESAPEESAPEESARQESAPEESAPEESARQESARQESAGEEVTGENLNHASDDFTTPASISVVKAELEGLAKLVGTGTDANQRESAHESAAGEDFERIVKKRRSGWNLAATGLLTILLILALAAQYVHYHRDSLLADTAWAPRLRQAYATLGMTLPPNWELDRYDIRQLGGIQDPSRPGVLVISISIRNQARRAQPYPVIRLVLEDRWGERVAKRDLQPAEYLDTKPGPQELMTAGKIIKAEIAVVEPDGVDATNFQVDACLENPQGGLDCANQL